MKKLIFFIFIISIFCFSQFTFAQDGPGTPGQYFGGVSGVFTFPTGDFGNIAGGGFGGTFQLGRWVMPNANLIAMGGINWFGSKTYLATKFDVRAIPLLFGGQYFFSNMFFAQGQLGITFLNTKTEILGSTVSQTDSEFTIALGAGLLTGAWQVSAFYNIISDANYFGTGIAFFFPIAD